MKAEIIAIGDEILIGQTLDTNSNWMASQLNSLGIEVTAITVVPDVRDRILEALDMAAGRSALTLITGGLGPTSDDITKNTLCEYFGTTLVRDDEVMQNIESILGRRGVTLNENNTGQAYVPASCRVLMNLMGTAPGMWFENGRRIFISMPGVPCEMKHIMTERVVPLLRSSGLGSEIMHRIIMTYGMPEAHLAEMLGPFESELPVGIRLAYLPSSGIIKLRLTARYDDVTFSEESLNRQVKKLKSIIPLLIYSEEEKSLEDVTGNLLKSKSLTFSTAESCTGGNIGRMITSVPGSSDYYLGGVIAYSNDLKEKILGVRRETIRKHGAVSCQCVGEMAEGVRRLTGSDISVATTGIAGPSGGTAAKPVGTVFIAVSAAEGTITESYVYGTDRILNVRRFSLAALNMARKYLTGL